jgi:hypothetical protein
MHGDYGAFQWWSLSSLLCEALKIEFYDLQTACHDWTLAWGLQVCIRISFGDSWMCRHDFSLLFATLWGIFLVWDFPKGVFGVKAGWSLVESLAKTSIIQDCRAGGITFQAIHCTHFYCREIWWLARGTAWRFFKFGIQSFAPDVEGMAAVKSSSLG